MKTRELFGLAVVLCLASLRGVNGWVEPEDPREDKSLYTIGVGIHDITGPAAGVNLMGYANIAQINKGIHFRLYSRAYIISDGTRRVVFLSADCGMMASILKIKLIPKLAELYGDLYTDENVILSGTHSHSGPAGYLEYLIFDITSFGFIDETFQAMLEGMLQSIVRAHENMKDGYIYINSGELVDASANRSPAAYENNPQEEKDQYDYNTDKVMTLLKFVDVDGNDLGMVNWFANHGTSMNNTNALISGDNKGYASMLFEKEMNDGDFPGEGSFVAAFAQANCGDASPNTQGAVCQDTGLPCDILTSTCNNRSQLCYAAGPGKDMMESTKIIGERQFEKAWELYHNSTEKLSGPVQFIQQYIDMGNYTFTLSDGSETTTCEPALGYSFAAGTTDGPGALDFTQGMTTDQPFWNMVVGAIVEPRPEQIECQAPKPVLLDTGNYNFPYAWHPRILDTQIGRIGSLFILAVPGEFTTMAGRRMKDKIIESALNNGLPDAVPVIAGLSNIYTHYITTFEEYQVQRYEGASTLYGPHTHEGYTFQYSYLLDSMANDAEIPKGPLPLDLYDVQVSLLPPVIYDRAEYGMVFGDVIAQPYPLVYKGETQVAVFVAGHPRNDVRLGGTFLTVERKVNNDTDWVVIATDAHWETRFTFDITAYLLGAGEVTVYWDIPEETLDGIYRINHFGNSKSFSSGQISEYQGVTEEFIVEEPPESRETYRDPIYVDPFGWRKHLFG